VLVAKQPGRASKTRLAAGLAASLDEETARATATAFALASLSDLLERLAGVCTRRVLLHAPPTDAARDELAGLLGSLAVCDQWELMPVLPAAAGGPPPDLGAVLADAAARCRSPNAPAVIFIGMDCPDLPAEEIVHAARVCSEPGHAYICPATDGGYVLLGLPADARADAVFAGVEWSAPETCASQVASLVRSGLRCTHGGRYRDVDEAEDLVALAHRLRCGPSSPSVACPRVKGLLAHFGEDRRGRSSHGSGG